MSRPVHPMTRLFKAWTANLKRQPRDGEDEEFNRKFAGCDPDTLRDAIDAYFGANPEFQSLPALYAVYRDRQHMAVDAAKAPPCAFCRGEGVLPLRSVESGQATLRYGTGCTECEKGRLFGRRFPSRERLPGWSEFLASEFNYAGGYRDFVHDRHDRATGQWHELRPDARARLERILAQIAFTPEVSHG